MVHSFCIGRTDENNEHDDDDGGSTAIPTRTFVGARSAIGKDHQWILEPLILLWGFITIPEYMYRFKQSVAKYELMVLDVTRVVYDKEDKNNRKMADKESIRLNEESLRRARERHKNNEWQEKKLSDIS